LNKPNNLFFILKDGDTEYFGDEERLKNFLDYGSIIKNKINTFFNEYKSKYSENAKLMKDNLTKKLIHDLKQFLKLEICPLMKNEKNLFKIIKNTKINSSYPYFIYFNDFASAYKINLNKPNNLFFIIKMEIMNILEMRKD
jgi:hypothetical protein